jgi:hypothetical protein
VTGQYAPAEFGISNEPRFGVTNSEIQKASVKLSISFRTNIQTERNITAWSIKYGEFEPISPHKAENPDEWARFTLLKTEKNLMNCTKIELEHQNMPSSAIIIYIKGSERFLRFGKSGVQNEQIIGTVMACDAELLEKSEGPGMNWRMISVIFFLSRDISWHFSQQHHDFARMNWLCPNLDQVHFRFPRTGTWGHQNMPRKERGRMEQGMENRDIVWWWFTLLKSEGELFDRVDKCQNFTNVSSFRKLEVISLHHTDDIFEWTSFESIFRSSPLN